MWMLFCDARGQGARALDGCSKTKPRCTMHGLCVAVNGSRLCRLESRLVFFAFCRPEGGRWRRLMRTGFLYQTRVHHDFTSLPRHPGTREAPPGIVHLAAPAAFCAAFVPPLCCQPLPAAASRCPVAAKSLPSRCQSWRPLPGGFNVLRKQRFNQRQQAWLCHPAWWSAIPSTCQICMWSHVG